MSWPALIVELVNGAGVGSSPRRFFAALDDEERWDMIERRSGSISDAGHEWDSDPAGWVHAQRFADDQRIG